MTQTLLTPTTLGKMQLKNRIVMAPMTRSRAIGNVPNELMEKYYAQRADAGLIITEGVSPSPNGLGYARIPGLFNEAQVRGWRGETETVEKMRARIDCDLAYLRNWSLLLDLQIILKTIVVVLQKDNAY